MAGGGSLTRRTHYAAAWMRRAHVFLALTHRATMIYYETPQPQQPVFSPLFVNVCVRVCELVCGLHTYTDVTERDSYCSATRDIGTIAVHVQRTGGWAVDDGRMRRWMLAMGTVVYIEKIYINVLNMRTIKYIIVYTTLDTITKKKLSLYQFCSSDSVMLYRTCNSVYIK
ncbi:hypothetical protein QTP88_014808 [Uroleucon formosanum]